MPDTKVCVKCRKPVELRRFDGNRKTCNTCRTHQKQVHDSLSYENYLKNLLNHSKSAVGRGNRVSDHEYCIDIEDLIDIWEDQKGKCALSGVFLTHHKDGTGPRDTNASIDRIANHKSYTRDNVQLVAYRVNLMKHTLSEGDFYWWIKNLFDCSCD
jgi:hypothetical protein